MICRNAAVPRPLEVDSFIVARGSWRAL